MIKVRENLLHLGSVRGQLQAHQTQPNAESSVIHVHSIWQELFRATLLDYYRLSTATENSETFAALSSLWSNYLVQIDEYLGTPIPLNSSRLAEDQHICEVHKNLLNTQINTIEEHLKSDDGNMLDRHNDLRNRLESRHIDILARSRSWREYTDRRDQVSNWLKQVDRSRQNIQLYYMELRTLTTIQNQINVILAIVPEGEAKLYQLKEAEQNLHYCTDDTLQTSMKISSRAMEERISNLKAGLKTWLNMVNNIKQLQESYVEYNSSVQEKLKECECIYITTNELNLVTETNYQNALNRLCNGKGHIPIVRTGIDKMSEIVEQLKDRVSTHETKSMRQMVDLLRHRCDDLDGQYLNLIQDCEEKMSRYGMFNERYNYLLDWIARLEERIHRLTLDISYVGDTDGVQRCIEDEIHIEMSKKERDRDWMVAVGKELLLLFSEANRNKEASDIQFKLNDILGRWDSVRLLMKSRSSELAEMKVTILKLEFRITELRTWLTHMEREFSKPVIFGSASEQALKVALEEISKLQKEIEDESLNFSEVLNLCDMILSDINVWKSHFNLGALSIAMESIEKRWKNLCHIPSDRKRQLRAVFLMFHELNRNHSEYSSWLNNRISCINQLTPPSEVTRSNIAEYLGKINVQVHEMNVKEDIRLNLEMSYRQLFTIKTLTCTNLVMLFGHVKDLLLLWSSTIEGVRAMETEQSDIFARFLDLHEDTVMRLTQIDAIWTDVEVTQLHETVRHKKVIDVQSRLDAVLILMTSTDDVGEQAQTFYLDKHPIQSMMDEYHKIYTDIRSRVEKSIQSEEVSEHHLYSAQAITLTEFTKKDAYLLELKGALKETDTHLKQFEKQLTEPKLMSRNKPAKLIGACQSSIELIEHLRNIIKSECNGTDEECSSDAVAGYSKMFNELLDKWKHEEQTQNKNR